MCGDSETGKSVLRTCGADDAWGLTLKVNDDLPRSLGC